MLGRIDTSVPRDLLKFGETAEDPKVRDIKLQKAARDFEALFIYQLLKTMRTSPTSGKKTGAGFGKDIFRSIADEAFAGKMSESGALGIGELIAGSLENGTNRPSVSADFDDDGAARFISLNRGRSTPIEMGSPRFIPLDAAQRNRSGSREKPASIDRLIRQFSTKYGLSAELIRAVIHVESSGDTNAVSSRGAKGLMQLTDSTAQDLGVKNVFDPKENIDAGAKYLSKLIKRFSGNIKLALAAYNAGPAAVEKHGGIPPYGETIRYVDKVLGLMQKDF